MGISRRGFLAAGALLPAARAERTEALEEEWRRIAAQSDGTVGVAALHLRTRQRASVNGEARFPLASVCKLPMAMNLLALVDEGKFRIDQMIAIRQEDVSPGVSEIAKIWPKQKQFRLDQMLRWMVAQSDNTAVQTLYREGGGAEAMAQRFRQWRIEGMRIDRDERTCGKDASASMPRFLEDPRDTSTPESAVRLLERLYAGELLRAPSTARMIEYLNATTTGAGRIKGLLPPGTVVGHKTGTTATVEGINGSTNDVGVVTLPAGAGQFALAIFVKGSRRDQEAREAVMALLARAAWDYWTR